jgi:hypothetical protein
MASTSLEIFAANSVISARPSSLRSAGRLLRRLAGKAKATQEKSVALQTIDAFILAIEIRQILKSVGIRDKQKAKLAVEVLICVKEPEVLMANGMRPTNHPWPVS